MSEWQPIDTAPTDGTLILGWSPHKDSASGHNYAVIWLELSEEQKQRGFTAVRCGWKMHKDDQQALFFWPWFWKPLDAPPMTEEIKFAQQCREQGLETLSKHMA